jgi:hypothetical protein
MNVYRLDHEHTYDRSLPIEEQNFYQELRLKDRQSVDKLTELYNQHGCFSGQPIGNLWQPIQVVFDKEVRIFKEFPVGDFPCLQGYSIIPIFSERAIKALDGLLHGNGELLPLTCDEGTYYAFNVTQIVNALDEECSEFKPLREINSTIFRKADPSKLGVTRFEFISEQVADLSIFRIPFKPNYSVNVVWVTDRFVQKAKEAGLKGFQFQLKWSNADKPTSVL